MERQSYMLELCVTQARAPKGADGLLIPLPPNTLHQTLRDVRYPAGWTVQRLAAAGSTQAALYMNNVDAFDAPIEMLVDVPGEAVNLLHFRNSANRFTESTADVDELFRELALEGKDNVQRLQHIAACLERRFSYHSDYDGTDEPMSLSCDALTGNCLDINTAFMKLLARAGIPCAYYIGYFFEAGHPLEVDDWHCWVSTLGVTGRQQDWDIAHHLKRQLGPVSPALNPIPGLRFAMSSGRSLEFILPAGVIEVSHLGLPRWVMRDGRTQECLVRVAASTCSPDAAIDRFVVRQSRASVASSPA